MTAGTWGFSAFCVLLLLTGCLALPAPEIETLGVDENTTLATDLRPPPVPTPSEEGEHYFSIFVINLYGVKNTSGESDAEILENEIIEHEPALLEPLATILLVVEEDEHNRTADGPVNLDEYADDLEKEGFTVERVKENGETKLIRVKMDGKSLDDVMTPRTKVDEKKKLRTKRTLCLKCKKRRGGGGGGCGGGGCPMMCGGGGCGGGGQYYGGMGYPSGGMMSMMSPSNSMMGYGGGGGCTGCGAQSSGMGMMAQSNGAMMMHPMMGQSSGMMGQSSGMMMHPSGMMAQSSGMMPSNGGCYGGCGNGHPMASSGGQPQQQQTIGVVPLVVVPVAVTQQKPQMQPMPQMHPMPPMHPMPSGCNTCGGGGYSHAQASASSSAQAWGK